MSEPKVDPYADHTWETDEFLNRVDEDGCWQYASIYTPDTWHGTFINDLSRETFSLARRYRELEAKLAAALRRIGELEETE